MVITVTAMLSDVISANGAEQSMLNTAITVCHSTGNRQQEVSNLALQEHSIHRIPTTYTMLLFQGIGSGQRQLIAVTCIAEHA